MAATNARTEDHGERGIALITSLLAISMMLALGLALLLSVTIDTKTSGLSRSASAALLAADTGLTVGRSALKKAMIGQLQSIKAGTTALASVTSVTGQFPDVLVFPDPGSSANAQYYKTLLATAVGYATNSTRNSTLTNANGSSFAITYGVLSSSVATQKTTVGSAIQTVTFRYAISSTGATLPGGSATVMENGTIPITIILSDTSSTSPTIFHFSGFGAFFDNGDADPNSYLASGTFSGPVHTNTHFSFLSSNNVAFTNQVTQGDNYIRYNSASFGQGHQNLPTLLNTYQGINVSSQGYAGSVTVPLPADNFSQEYAVINGNGITAANSSGVPVFPPAVIPVDSKGSPLAVIDSSGRVTANALQANLRTASDSQPVISNNSMASGVYISSSDGTSIAGAGIYVQGDASDIKLYTSGTDQMYVIQQGGTTTTIDVNYTNNTTRVTSGSKTTTFQGIPTDNSVVASTQPGVSLFVNGSINSLHGAVGGGTSGAAIAAKTRLTITAQRMITITGDLTYANPVANSDGSPATNINSITNVLGIFTNNGNVNLAPNSNWVSGPGLSLEIDAAIVSFNSITSDDGGNIEGSITYTGGNAPGNSDAWKLVGSRVQASINNIGYSKRNVYFDQRFGGGNFAPPFFPGTSYTLGGTISTDLGIVNWQDPHAIGISWSRITN
jgi:hypothetical protein